MLSEKYIKSVLSAPPEKRYKTFLTKATDEESVWVLVRDEGIVMHADETGAYLLCWPAKEFAEIFALDGDVPCEIEVHDFISLCREEILEEKIMVFPADNDSFVMSGTNLANDLEIFLNEVE